VCKQLEKSYEENIERTMHTKILAVIDYIEVKLAQNKQEIRTSSHSFVL